jgi:hypothetical protein
VVGPPPLGRPTALRYLWRQQKVSGLHLVCTTALLRPACRTEWHCQCSVVKASQHTNAALSVQSRFSLVRTGVRACWIADLFQTCLSLLGIHPQGLAFQNSCKFVQTGWCNSERCSSQSPWLSHWLSLAILSNHYGGSTCPTRKRRCIGCPYWHVQNTYPLPPK